MATTPRFAKVFSAELEGVHAKIIDVEVDLHVGLHAFNIVGLADKALNEAKERVGAAIKNSGAKPPSKENRKITVNLAPADFKKTGSQYDLAIAVGYLLATSQIKTNNDIDHSLFVGELALDGALRPIHGALNIAEFAQKKGFKSLILPTENAEEASVIEGIETIPCDSLGTVIKILEGNAKIPIVKKAKFTKSAAASPDFSEIKGQDAAKRALIIAAAGGHNVLMMGPPGVGKSMLAHALAGILPCLTHEEAIDVTKIWSAAGLRPAGLMRERPFRSPHQTASPVSIIGGGTNPRPGEISLAHRGVLFLDEFPEFPKNILEALRAPLESGSVHVARAKQSLSFPSKFILVAAMNPCPCGYYGDGEVECRCGAHEVMRYQKKISGPLLDRIDIQIQVPRVPLNELRLKYDGVDKSEYIKEQISFTREIQVARLASEGISINSEMSSKQTEKYSALTENAEKLFASMHKKSFSPRSYYRILKVARTIADLENEECVKESHLAEAFSYRLRDEAWI